MGYGSSCNQLYLLYIQEQTLKMFQLFWNDSWCLFELIKMLVSWLLANNLGKAGQYQKGNQQDLQDSEFETIIEFTLKLVSLIQST